MPETPPPPPPGSSPEPWPRPGTSEGPTDDPPPPPPPPEALLGAGSGASGGRRTTGWLLAGLLLVLLAASVAVGVRNGLRPAVDEVVIGEVAPGAEVPAPLVASEVEQRREAAGCEVTVNGAPLEDRTHLDPSTAPPPDALYPDRPAHSGQHFGRLLALPDGTEDQPLDERAVVHNMEHGSVVVWFRPDTGMRGDVTDWRASRARFGFTSPSGGAVFASPMPDLAAPPAVALRAWGVAMDCEQFDPVVADAFLVDHWGSHGDAPEATLSPYPTGSLAWSEPA